MSLTTLFVAEELIDTARSLREISTELNNQAMTYETATKLLVLANMLIKANGGEQEKSS